MYTLIVVDMQSGFHSANGKGVRAGCLAAVKQAVKDDAYIIFLEYFGHSPTHLNLVKEAYKHGRYSILTKDEDDGSNEIQNEVRKHQLSRKFKICGINTDCCVKATVEGLTARFPRSTIEVLSAACASDWFHLKGLEALRKLNSNVKVI